jgi:hypothetical protein
MAAPARAAAQGMMMNKLLFAAAIAVLFATPAAAKEKAALRTMPGELTLYSYAGFNGDEYMIKKANSEIVLDWSVKSLSINPGDHWQLCLKPRYREPCIEVTESIPDTATINLTGGLASARLIAPK